MTIDPVLFRQGTPFSSEWRDALAQLARVTNEYEKLHEQVEEVLLRVSKRAFRPFRPTEEFFAQLIHDDFIPCTNGGLDPEYAVRWTYGWEEIEAAPNPTGSVQDFSWQVKPNGRKGTTDALSDSGQPGWQDWLDNKPYVRALHMSEYNNVSGEAFGFIPGNDPRNAQLNWGQAAFVDTSGPQQGPNIPVGFVRPRAVGDNINVTAPWPVLMSIMPYKVPFIFGDPGNVQLIIVKQAWFTAANPAHFECDPGPPPP